MSGAVVWHRMHSTAKAHLRKPTINEQAHYDTIMAPYADLLAELGVLARQGARCRVALWSSGCG
jgi:hypothetical protein